MAIEVSTKGGIVPVMNVTPLVDVVLVLLIVFMIMTPLLTKKFWVHVPQQERIPAQNRELTNAADSQLVLRVGADRTITVNGVPIGLDDLPVRLRRMFAARADHILFFDAADETPYGFAVQVMDQARGGGAVSIAALTSPLRLTPPDPSR